MQTCSYCNIRGGGNRIIKRCTVNKIASLSRAGVNIFEGLSGQLPNLLQILFVPFLGRGTRIFILSLRVSQMEA